MNVHNIDLQYHAGLERQGELTLDDYLTHARLTGRQVLGLTDHLGIYLHERDAARYSGYQRNLAGLEEYHADVVRAREKYPDLQLLFAPELSGRELLEDIPCSVTDLADLFIAEVPFLDAGDTENTTAICDRLEELADWRDTVGTPLFVPHPFRGSINRRLVKADPEPWVTDLPLRSHDEYDLATIDRFMMFDVATVAETAAARDIPVEVNGNTHYRTRGTNLPAALQVLRAGCSVFHSEGVELVPGSDQHGFQKGIGRVGGYVPWETFQILGIGLDGLQHLEELGVEFDVRHA